MKIKQKLSLKKKDIAILNEGSMRAINGGGDHHHATEITYVACLSNAHTHCASDNCPGSFVNCGGTNESRSFLCPYTTFKCL